MTTSATARIGTAARQGRQAAGFAYGLYRQRAVSRYYGYVRREPLARLDTRPGRADPYRIYDQLRDRGPMSPTRLGNWMTPSHEICSQVLRDRRLGARPLDAAAPAVGEVDLSFLEMNPPDHTRLRRLVAPAFSPKQMAGYRDRIESRVDALLDATSATFDLVGAFAAPLPIGVISDLLGIPPERTADFERYGATLGSALDGVLSLGHARALMQADKELEVLFTELFELRRRDPSDDIVSTIVAAEGGDQVQPAEMLPLCVLLLVAGFETTVNLISNAVLALLDHPEQWELLSEDPSLAASAIEETLRFDPPVQRTSRVAHEPLEIAGVPVRRDQWVITLIGGANRDPAVYESPERFDITRRRTVEHLAFSGGIHYCIGQPLARLEATTALTALVTRMPRLRHAGQVVRRRSTTIRGPLRLPVSA